MTMYDPEDEYEPTEEEELAHTVTSATLRVDGVSVERIESEVARQWRRENEKELDKKLREVVSKALDETFATLIEQRMTAEIEAILAEGWVQTDTWGHPRGERLTLRQRINAYLDGKDGDGYRDHDKPTRLNKILAATLQEALNKDLNGVVEDAKKKFRAQVDGEMTERITAAFRAALGGK